MDSNVIEQKKKLLEEYDSLFKALLQLRKDYPNGIKYYDMRHELYELGLTSINRDIYQMSDKMLEEKKPRKITHIKNSIADMAENVQYATNYLLDMDLMVILGLGASTSLFIASSFVVDPQLKASLLVLSIPTIFIPGLFAISVGMPLQAIVESIERNSRVDFESQRNDIFKKISKMFNQYSRNKDVEKFNNDLKNLLINDDVVIDDDNDKETTDGGFTKWLK